MDVCLRLSVLCCPVSVEALHWVGLIPHQGVLPNVYVDREVH
jgi:hypothetical protein